MEQPPKISESTRSERMAYVKETFRCKADCDICGNCKFLRGGAEEDVFAEYIDVERNFEEIVSELRCQTTTH